MKNFKTYNLAKNLYRACQGLKMPNRHFRDQLQRASLSIVLNLAEGVGRRTAKDRRRHYHIAFGSLREVQALLDIIEANHQAKLADQIAGCLYKLLRNPGGS